MKQVIKGIPLMAFIALVGMSCAFAVVLNGMPFASSSVENHESQVARLVDVKHRIEMTRFDEGPLSWDGQNDNARKSQQSGVMVGEVYVMNQMLEVMLEDIKINSLLKPGELALTNGFDDG